MIQWKDETSYSQIDKDRIPRTWCAKVGEFDLIVTRIVHYPDIWFLRSRALGIEPHELKRKEIQEAKCEAIRVFRATIRDRVEKLQAAFYESGEGDE